MKFASTLAPICALLFSSVASQTTYVTTGVVGTATAVSTAAAQATVPITVSGNAFFRGSSRFYMRGVDYQPGGSSSTVDPLANKASCDRDIPYFQQLGINTIRVYQVDNSANHDYCMNLLSKAGIYLVLDVNTALNSINRDNAASSYTATYLQGIFATVDAFKNYTNTMAFFAGNEVVNDDATVPVATWVKAVVRDLKQYITAQSKRYIPVGYSAADVLNTRYALADYFNCGSNATRVDFYAFNSYVWCGASSFTQSGYDQLVQGFSNYSIPLFFSEYGCNLVTPRIFTEVEAIYNTEMTSVFSGGLVYEYSQEVSNYGLVYVQDGSSTVTVLQDYTNLKNEFAKTANPTGNGGYQMGLAASVCPSNTSTFSGIWAQDVLPAQPAGAAALIKNGAGTALGSGSGSSSQSTGTGSTGTSNSGTTSASAARSGSASASASSTTKSGSVKVEAGSYAMLALLTFTAALGMII